MLLATLVKLQIRCNILAPAFSKRIIKLSDLIATYPVQKALNATQLAWFKCFAVFSTWTLDMLSIFTDFNQTCDVQVQCTP